MLNDLWNNPTVKCYTEITKHDAHIYTGIWKKCYILSENQSADLSFSVSLSTPLALPPQHQCIHSNVAKSQKRHSPSCDHFWEKNRISKRQRDRWRTKIFHFLLCILLDYFIISHQEAYILKLKKGDCS